MTLEEKIKELLGREKHVELAYLFGSAARGEAGKLSDIDVAVYLDESLTPGERFDLRLELIGKLTFLLGTDNVDLVVMNDVPILLKYNIIKEGTLLRAEKGLKAKVESDILSKYLDMKYYIDRHAREGLKRVAKEGIL
ncbi:MAG: nucleotidyltransferase domain-containing protein [Candidatus Hadarchaeota archaeon]|nr:nucleotidyltransferase domain-containing protein [Candidatus Hadarchaeota archaeon]